MEFMNVWIPVRRLYHTMITSNALNHVCMRQGMDMNARLSATIQRINRLIIMEIVSFNVHLRFMIDKP